MMLFLLIFVIFKGFFSSEVKSYNTFFSLYGGNDLGETIVGNDVVYDSNGFLSCGYILDPDYNSLLKVNEEQQIVYGYKISYGSDNGADICRKIFQSDDSNYLVGFSSTYDGYIRGTIAKFNLDGSLSWSKLVGDFGGTDEESNYGGVVLSDGSIIVCGAGASATVNFLDGYLMKMTENDGGGVWWSYFEHSGSESNFKVIKEYLGDIIVVGLYQDATFNFLFAKFNTDGELLLAKYFGTSYHEEPESFALHPDGGFIISGRTHTPGIYLVVAKLNSTYHLEWSKTYRKDYDMIPTSLIIVNESDPFSDIIVAGELNIDHRKSILLRIDYTGGLVWAKYLFGRAENSATSISLAEDGETVLVGGRTKAFSDDTHTVTYFSQFNLNEEEYDLWYDLEGCVVEDYDLVDLGGIPGAGNVFIGSGWITTMVRDGVPSIEEVKSTNYTVVLSTQREECEACDVCEECEECPIFEGGFGVSIRQSCFFLVFFVVVFWG